MMARLWSIITWPFRWLAALIAAPKFFRRVVLIWCAALITFVVYRTFQDGLLAVIQTPGATIVVSFVGILATIVGFYIQLRHIDERQGHD